MSNPKRFFLAGDINGHFGKVYNTINAQENKLGYKFDYLLGVGNTISSSDTNNDDSQRLYISGQQKVSLAKNLEQTSMWWQSILVQNIIFCVV